MAKQRDKLLTVPPKRETRIKLGPIELGIAMGIEEAERVRKSLPYQYLLRPALNGLRRVVRSSNGHRLGAPATRRAPQTSGPPSPEARAVLDKISDVEWYHTIDLPHGVATPGYVDHRQQLPYYSLPEDMTGMRVLDVATFDGFWAFEFERRGAEVVAIDVGSVREADIPTNWIDEFEKAGLDAPKGKGFQIAHELLGSKVQKEVCSVYDVSPKRLGKFDMAFCSDLLIHLRDPARAMESIWTVTENFAIFADVYHPQLDAFKDNALVEFTQAGQSDMWWRPSVTCYKLWLHLARFSRVEEISRFVLESNYRSEIPKVVFHAYR
jgi:tRNA (mo5U34)-methyltransferase